MVFITLFNVTCFLLEKYRDFNKINNKLYLSFYPFIYLPFKDDQRSLVGWKYNFIILRIFIR